MNTTQTPRPRHEPATRTPNADLSRDPNPHWPHPWPDPTHIHDGDPLDDLAPDRLAALLPEILADWDNPIMTGLGLCRQHRITLAQLHAIAALPRFQHALESLRAVHEARRPAIEARSRATAIDRLICCIATHEPTTATHAKEVRLAIKALLTLVTPPPDPKGSPERSERAGQAKTTAPPTTPAAPHE